jgi:hypothetical protein
VFVFAQWQTQISTTTCRFRCSFSIYASSPHYDRCPKLVSLLCFLVNAAFCTSIDGLTSSFSSSNRVHSGNCSPVSDRDLPVPSWRRFTPKHQRQATERPCGKRVSGCWGGKLQIKADVNLWPFLSWCSTHAVPSQEYCNQLYDGWRLTLRMWTCVGPGVSVFYFLAVTSFSLLLAWFGVERKCLGTCV